MYEVKGGRFASIDMEQISEKVSAEGYGSMRIQTVKHAYVKAKVELKRFSIPHP
jgi:hypothetical protein